MRKNPNMPQNSEEKKLHIYTWPDMIFVNIFTLADFWPKNVYPKVRKSTFSTFHDKSA